MKSSHVPLHYHPENLKRELKPFYIGADDKEIKEMLHDLGLSSLDELYSHIDSSVKLNELPMPKHLSYEELIVLVNEVAAKNHPKISFFLQDFYI